MAVANVTWKVGETTAPVPPLAPGLPVVGNALDMGRDPARFFVAMYRQLGPIFRVRVFNREITVLAGVEANNLVKEEDENVFTNTITFGYIRDEVGPLMTSMENETHTAMRRLLRASYGRGRAAQHIPTMVSVVDDFVDGLRVGDSFEVFPTMQALVVTQLGHLMLNTPPGDYLPDFRTFMKTILEVYQFSTRPRWFLRLPAYKRAKARVFEMAQQIVDYHRRVPAGEGRPETALDVLMNTPMPDGTPYSEAALLAEAIGPYLAGQDTVAGTLSFIGYTTHKYPDVQARVSAEARAKFTPDLRLNDMRQFEDLHRVIVETMRLYPIAAAMPRHARRTFEFGGYRVDAGAEVYSATAVTHFLPEHYDDPFTFNIDRAAGPSGAFVPYGVGNYACLGAGIADVQMLVTMGALLRRGRFVLDPVDYTMKLSVMPLPNPGRYRLKLVEKYS